MNTYIFDMDGTLFQTDRILELSLADTFRHLESRGYWDGPAPLKTYRDIMGVPLPRLWEILLPDQPESVRFQADRHFLDSLIRNITHDRGALYPNAITLLKHLKEAGCAIFIASNGLTPYLESLVAHYGLDRFVTETFSIERIPSLNKSDLVRLILEQHAVTEAVVVGDRLSDFKAARDNGLLSIGCRFDFSDEAELAQADFVVDDLAEIMRLPLDAHVAR